MYFAVVLLCCGVGADDRLQNTIHLGEYQVSVDSDWMIMGHDPLTSFAKFLSVAVTGAHLVPDYGMTYMVIDMKTEEGKKAYGEVTNWHADAGKTKEYKSYTCYAAQRKNRGKDVVALNYVLKREDDGTKILVTAFKPTPDGFSGDLEKLMDVAHVYADRVAKRRK